MSSTGMLESSLEGEVLAAVAVAPGRTELRSLPIPAIAPDAGLMRIDACGICGSDWGMYNNVGPGPRILGHEMVGRVVALGDVARARWGVSEGDLIALEEYLPCGHCEYCRSGEIRSCLQTDTRVAGSIRYGSTPIDMAPGLWGGYARHVYMHPRSVIHRVPERVAPHIAAMALPIGNGFQWAFLDGGAGPGRVVVIQGPGQQGLGCVIASVVAGASCVIMAGLARDAGRLEVARKLGASDVVVVDQQNLQEEVHRITGGQMADLVVDATGAGPAIVNPSIGLLRKRGTLVVASRKGMPVFGFDIDQIVNKQILLRGTRGHSFAAVELALEVMRAGRFPLELIATHRVGLAEVDQALRMVGGDDAQPCIHVTVEPWS